MPWLLTALCVCHHASPQVTDKLLYCVFCLTAVGAFTLQPAVDIQPGDKIVVTLKDKAGTINFAVVKVDTNERIPATGLYLPVIEQPYIVVDGVVMPL